MCCGAAGNLGQTETSEGVLRGHVPIFNQAFLPGTSPSCFCMGLLLVLTLHSVSILGNRFVQWDRCEALDFSVSVNFTSEPYRPQ